VSGNGTGDSNGDSTAAARGLADNIVSIGHEGIEVDCGVIPADTCAGHFPDYPAAPVAIVMGRLCRAAGLALAARLDADVAYQIEEGHVVASRLARAGQRLELQASYDRPVSGGHLLHGTAIADGEVVGEVDVTMSATEASSRVPPSPAVA
jgi:3-hydroxymyristoyl/3-hydroxydecanoyl-(acyl carrier protein) dehydratase